MLNGNWSLVRIYLVQVDVCRPRILLGCNVALRSAWFTSEVCVVNATVRNSFLGHCDLTMNGRFLGIGPLPVGTVIAPHGYIQMFSLII